MLEIKWNIQAVLLSETNVYRDTHESTPEYDAII